MSHLDPRKGSTGAPCLRSMRSPPDEVKADVAKATKDAFGSPKEAWLVECSSYFNSTYNNI